MPGRQGSREGPDLCPQCNRFIDGIARRQDAVEQTSPFFRPRQTVDREGENPVTRNAGVVAAARRGHLRNSGIEHGIHVEIRGPGDDLDQILQGRRRHHLCGGRLENDVVLSPHLEVAQNVVGLERQRIERERPVVEHQAGGQGALVEVLARVAHEEVL